MKWVPTLFLSFSAGLAATACDGPAAVPVTPSTTALYESQMYVGRGTPNVYVLVVDDADTPEAAELRQHATEALRAALLGNVRSREDGCWGTNDPAEWRPGDDQVVIVRPSAPTALSLVTPIDRPALAWKTITSKAEEVDAVVAAAAEALEARLAAPGESYRPLRAARRALDLMEGLHAPETDAEAEFVASLARGTMHALLLASTRDDEDVAPPADLLPSELARDSTYRMSLVVPSNAGEFGCQIFKQGKTRLEAWGKLVYSTDYAWPCDDKTAWANMLGTSYFLSCGLPCLERPLQIDASGRAECKFHVAQPDLEQCDPAKGWRDPTEGEAFAEYGGEKLRRCEIVQHEGADLEACRTSPDCPDCPSGFCVTEVDFFHGSTCPEGEYLWNFRFTGGARAVPFGLLEMSCATKDD
ncbi:hypothetical protein [Polyangium spumosum]|uniref:Uncharacterized protein n=1 Tax=Polyangium spumosum TaxID=889282 RepID=A0A6N7PQC1_9BACT|nr:hypothetical protein [Polyangium spumosum]MRG92405.1 hypothetical protein [Polyangium spumosum]